MTPWKNAVPQCRADSKRSGKRCRRNASKGRTVCASHGGKSLTGREHPAFKTGRYSKYLPERLLEKYHTAMESGDLTGLEQEIALIEAKTADALERMTTGDGAAGVTAWMDLTAAYASLRTELVRPEPDPARLRSAVVGMDHAVQRGGDEARAWREILGLIEARRRLVDTERRRLSDEDKAISIERLMVLCTAIIDVIRRNVASREQREAMANEIRLLASGSHDGR